jgi:N-formylglutamate amidohydrolase
LSGNFLYFKIFRHSGGFFVFFEEIVMLTSYPGLIVSNHDFTVVLSHQKSSRVIISVPHDCLIANDFINMFQSRRNGETVRDLYVWPIVNDIVWHCLQSEMKIDATRFLLSRTYVDANRERKGGLNLCPDTLGQTAFDDPNLAVAYERYHGELENLISQSVREHGAENILLLDVHGFSKQPKYLYQSTEDDDMTPYDLILGTASRTTINHGEVDRQFASFMARKMYAVFLPEEQSILPGGDPYSAGYITRLHAKKYSINAMQIEISSTFRRTDIRKDARERGQKLAQDIAEFLSVHCK